MAKKRRLICGKCGRKSDYDPDTVQKSVQLLESRNGGSGARILHVQCPHCGQWNDIHLPGGKQ
jgi:ribosomal protein S27AE